MITCIQEPVVNSIVQELQLTFQPTALYIYGSQAQGTARPDSDYDFAMVVDGFKAENRLSKMMKIAESFQHQFDVQVQVWIYSPEEFREGLNDFGSIPETAVNTGREIEL